MTTTPRRIKITYREHCPRDLIELALDSGFGGFGKTYRGPEERIIYISPFRDSYDVLKAQLKVLEEAGDLSFVEE